MNIKKEVYKKSADKKIIRTNLFIRFITFGMGVVVMYDSFIHNIPLYYILFVLAGWLVGKLFFFTHKIVQKENTSKITLKSNRWSIALLLLMFVFRFFIGKQFLESFNTIWASDGILLLFIGIYHSKWNTLVKQMDELYYKLLSK